MTVADRGARIGSRGLDRLSRVELSGLGAYSGVVAVLAVGQLVATVRNESSPGPTSWAIALAAGAVASAVAMIGVAWEWRRHGGRAVQRHGRRALWSNRLPEQLPARLAVLHDLERRERRLARSWLPLWVVAVICTAPVALNVLDQPSLLKTVTWLLLWSLYLVPGMLDLIDRRLRARRLHLIDELRRDPLPHLRSAGLPG